MACLHKAKSVCRRSRWRLVAMRQPHGDVVRRRVRVRRVRVAGRWCLRGNAADGPRAGHGLRRAKRANRLRDGFAWCRRRGGAGVRFAIAEMRAVAYFLRGWRRAGVILCEGCVERRGPGARGIACAVLCSGSAAAFRVAIFAPCMVICVTAEIFYNLSVQMLNWLLDPVGVCMRNRQSRRGLCAKARQVGAKQNWITDSWFAGPMCCLSGPGRPGGSRPKSMTAFCMVFRLQAASPEENRLRLLQSVRCAAF